MGFFDNVTRSEICKGSFDNIVSVHEFDEFTGTTMAKINIGICEGYNNENPEDNSLLTLDGFSNWLYETLEDISDEKYVSFTVSDIRTIYKKSWGCPNGGERTYNLEAVRNPLFNSFDDKWRENVLSIVAILKKLLKQSTVTVQFIPVDMIYMKDKEK